MKLNYEKIFPKKMTNNPYLSSSEKYLGHKDLLVLKENEDDGSNHTNNDDYEKNLKNNEEYYIDDNLNNEKNYISENNHPKEIFNQNLEYFPQEYPEIYERNNENLSFQYNFQNNPRQNYNIKQQIIERPSIRIEPEIINRNLILILLIITLLII